jgi:hypothetical protein
VRKILFEKLLPRSTAKQRQSDKGLVKPFMDLGVKNNKRKYARLIRKLFDSGIIEFRRSCREQVGVFTVWKKSGAQRLVVDARLVNEWFSAPEHVQLATGSTFGNIEVDDGPPVCLGGVDIKDAFYQFELPEELRDLFGLPAILASFVDIEVLFDGTKVGCNETIVPVFRAVPMGWTQALWICQICHETIALRVKNINYDNRLVDKTVVVPLKPFAHTEYVDNFIALSQNIIVVEDLAVKVKEQLKLAGCRLMMLKSRREASLWGGASRLTVRRLLWLR